MEKKPSCEVMIEDSYISGYGRTEEAEDCAHLLKGFDKYWGEPPSIKPTGDWGFFWYFVPPEERLVVDGAIQDLLEANFSNFLRLRQYHGGNFDVVLFCGAPHPEMVVIDPTVVAMLSAMGAKLQMTKSDSGGDR